VTTPPLFLLDPLPAGDSFVLGGDEGRHAARARRLGVGERLQVGDGRGAVVDCVVDALVPDGLQLRVLARRDIPAPDRRLVVVQALPKGDRAELSVELVTELGADEIVPWAAARSVAQWHGPRGEKALAKWRRTAAEAAKQSRRAWAPLVSDLATTAAVAGRLAAGNGFVLHESAELALAGAGVSGSGEVIIVVGPEGGITDDELTAFGAAGAATVRLGEPVLRTSTAGAAALAVLSARLGRWS
jgi:16S rRNA (uracil1498-N3)-methyltransferase